MAPGEPAAEWMRVATFDVSSSRSGSRPGNRLARRVLPAPGGPTINRWCPPVAATSSARRATSWPRTSARSPWSTTAPACAPPPGGADRGQGRRPVQRATTSASVGAVTQDPPARAASTPFSSATTSRWPARASASTRAPGTPRTDPSRPSSPTKAYPATASAASTPEATSTPTAMGRSRPAPPLRMPDGARLTVTRRRGHGRPLETRAARTRSRDSRTAASGRPTTVNPGRPLATWTSTRTVRPSTPRRTAEGMLAITGGSRRVHGLGRAGVGQRPVPSALEAPTAP